MKTVNAKSYIAMSEVDFGENCSHEKTKIHGKKYKCEACGETLDFIRPDRGTMMSVNSTGGLVVQ